MIRHFSPYDQVASEYYDAVAHPTCRNFRDLGRAFFVELLEMEAFRATITHGRILETGCGMSMVAEAIECLALDFPKNLTLQDDSERMLEYSNRWRNRLTDVFISDARQMPPTIGAMNSVFSFLADPYNDTALWNEINRVLEPGGFWILTVPAHSWALSFRHKSGAKMSRFVTENGDEFDLPSTTYPPHQIIAGLLQRGIHLRSFKSYTVADIIGSVSQKLLVNDGLESVLDCYAFQKTGRP